MNVCDPFLNSWKMNFPSEVRRDDATSLEEMEALVVMGGLECFFFFLQLSNRFFAYSYE